MRGLMIVTMLLCCVVIIAHLHGVKTQEGKERWFWSKECGTLNSYEEELQPPPAL